MIIVSWYGQQNVASIQTCVKICFWTPKGLDFDTERSNLRNPSVARCSKAKRSIKIMTEWGPKTDFQTSFMETTVSFPYYDT